MKKVVFLLLAALLPGSAAAAELGFTFYGAPISLELQGSLLQAPSLSGALSREQLETRIRSWDSEAMQQLSASLKQAANSMLLDDVATARLVHFCAEHLYGETPDAALFEWLLLRYCNYDVLLGLGGGFKVYLQFAFMTEGTQFITFMGKKYTLPQGEPDPFSGKVQVFISFLEPNGLRNAVFFNMHQLPLLGKSRRIRKCNFSYGGKDYKLYIPWMDDVVDYLNDLPVISLGPLFYQSPVNIRAQRILHDSLSQWTRGLSPQQSLDFLLAFMQQSFPYRRDRDYLRFDRHNFAEQTLAAAFSDCEDKAVLFALLVRDVLGLPSAFIYNKGLEHISVAVAWNLPASEPTTAYLNQRYLICEPANYGYRAGDTRLPRNNPGEFILLDEEI
jgi:hypothetical protein